MRKINPNEPAHPVTFLPGEEQYSGLTIRAEFAKAAMLGILSGRDNNRGLQPLVCAIEALGYADALIEELNREEPPYEIELPPPLTIAP